MINIMRLYTSVLDTSLLNLRLPLLGLRNEGCLVTSSEPD